MKILIKTDVWSTPPGLDQVGDLAITAGPHQCRGQPMPDFAADRVIDTTGLVVVPGLVDLAARLRNQATSTKACWSLNWLLRLLVV